MSNMFIFFYPKAGNANGGKYYFGEKHRVWCNNKLHKSLTYLQNWRSEDQIISLLSLEASLKLLLKFLLKIKRCSFLSQTPFLEFSFIHFSLPISELAVSVPAKWPRLKLPPPQNWKPPCQPLTSLVRHQRHLSAKRDNKLPKTTIFKSRVNVIWLL